MSWIDTLHDNTISDDAFVGAALGFSAPLHTDDWLSQCPWNSKRDISSHFASVLEKFDNMMEDGEPQLVEDQMPTDEESELRDLFGIEDSEEVGIISNSERRGTAPSCYPGIPPGLDVLYGRSHRDVRAKIVWQVQRLPILRFLDAIAIPRWRKLAALIPRLRVRNRATGSHPSQSLQQVRSPFASASDGVG